MFSLESLGRIGKYGIDCIIVLCALNSCQYDSRYDIENLKNLDLTVTLFEGGVEFPVGHTGRVTVKKLAAMGGDGMDSFLEGNEDGSYAISYSGEMDLSDRFAELDLASLRTLDGLSFSAKEEVDLGIDESALSIKGFNWYSSGRLSPFSSLPDVDMLPENPRLKVDLPSMYSEINVSESFAINVKAMSRFGEYSIFPKASTELTVEFDLPAKDKLEYSSSDNGISVRIPDWAYVSDISAISPAPASFDPATGIFVFKGPIPERVTVSISRFDISPDKDGCVSGVFEMSGSVITAPTKITLGELKELEEASVEVTASFPDIKAGTLVLSSDLSAEMSGKVDFNLLSSGSIPSGVEYLSEITLEDTRLELNIDAAGLPHLDSGAYELDLTISLPECISPSEIVAKGSLDTQGHFSIDPVDILSIKDIDLSSGTLPTFSASLTGTLRAKSPSIKLDNLADAMTINAKVAIAASDGNVHISGIRARCSQSAEYSESISFGDVPPMFRNEGTCLDLRNSELCIELTGNTGIPLTADLQIVPWLSGKACEGKLSLYGIELPCTPDPSRPVVKSISLGSEELAPLLRVIPDSLQISIRAAVDPKKDCVADPSAEYAVSMNYSLNLPLEIGENFSLCFADTLEVGQELADYMDMATIGLVLDVENTIPLGLELSIDFLDGEGNFLREEIGTSINTGHGNASEASLTHAEILLEKKPEIDMSRLAALRMEYRLNGDGCGDALNAEDWISACLSARLPQGLTLDLREL